MGCGAGEKAVGRDPSAFAPRAQLKIPHLARSLAGCPVGASRPAKPGQRIDGALQKPSARCLHHRCSARFHSLPWAGTWCLAYFRTCQTVNYKLYKKNWV